MVEQGDGIIAGPPTIMAGESMCLGTICQPGFPVARFEVPSIVPAGFPCAAEIMPAAPPTAFSQFRAMESVQPFGPSTPLATDGQATTFNILPPNSTVQPDMRILASGEVEFRPGFAELTGRPAQINVAIEDGASAANIQNAINLTANQFDSRWANQDIRLTDTGNVLAAHEVNPDFLTNFNRDHHHQRPNPHDQDDIHPPPEPNNDTRPGPRPGPGPDDNHINPDNNDRDNNPDVNPNPNNNDANRTREFLNSFGDILRRGGMHPRYYGNFLGAILPTRIKNILARLADDPDNADIQNELRTALTENDGALAREITTNLNQQAQALETAGDRDGATALRAFGRQLLGEDGRTPNMQMFGNLASFLKKVENGTASATDVQQLFPAGTNPSANVIRAITNLALLDAARGANLLTPPTNPTERASYRQRVEQMLMRLQTEPNAFNNLFNHH
ncbi:MAG: hypothetical protein C5B53_04245 [Candidatus Melainabacteria bacterium]|nr:MAG: hypothetical protein C5B53_04245 [Candidatus Melainabacteria bacterium]